MKKQKNGGGKKPGQSSSRRQQAGSHANPNSTMGIKAKKTEPFMASMLASASAATSTSTLPGVPEPAGASTEERVISSDSSSIRLMPPPTLSLGVGSTKVKSGYATSTPMMSPCGPSMSLLNPDLNKRGKSPMRNVGGGEGDGIIPDITFNETHCSGASAMVQEPDQNLSDSGEDSEELDRGDELLRSMLVLAHMHALDIEKKRISSKNVEPTQGSSKKRSKYNLDNYPFTGNMFTSDCNNNTGALLSVTHLCLELLDLEATTKNFQCCWPAHDKKQQAEYRRILYQWINEIVDENLEFFTNGKPPFSVFVSPCGDRCLKFIEEFVQYTMFTLADRQHKEDPLKRPPPLRKFELTSDPEITNLQYKILDERYNSLLKSCVDIQKKTMLMMDYYDERELQGTAYINDYHVWAEKELNILVNEVRARPDLFPKNAQDLLAKRKDLVSDAVRKYCNLKMNPKIDDPLASVINKVWLEKLAEAKTTFDNMNTFFEKHERLWQILEAYETNHQIVLDMNKLYFEEGDATCVGGTTDGTTNHLPELCEFFTNVTQVFNEFRQNVDKIENLSPELIAHMISQEERIKNINERKERILKSRPIFDIDEAMKRTMFQIKSISMKLEGTDWSRLSKCTEEFLQDNFTWSPQKEINFDKEIKHIPTFEQLKELLPENNEKSPPELLTNTNPEISQCGSMLSSSDDITVLESSLRDTPYITVIKNSNDLDISGSMEFSLGIPVTPINNLRDQKTGSGRTNRILNAFRLSQSPNFQPPCEDEIKKKKEKRKSLIDRILPRDTSETESVMFGNTSFLEDLDEAMGGIMDESMINLFNSSTLSPEKVLNMDSSEI